MKTAIYEFSQWFFTLAWLVALKYEEYGILVFCTCAIVHFLIEKRQSKRDDK